MEKNLILLGREMKEEFVAVANKYISKVPAFIIVDTLQEMQANMGQVAEQQYEQALVEYKENNKCE